MSELLDAIIHLCDALLTPFTSGSSPRKKWMMIVGSLIAILGVTAVIIFVIQMFLPMDSDV